MEAPVPDQDQLERVVDAVKRYRIFRAESIEEDADGDWVMASDLPAELKELRAENEKLRGKIADLLLDAALAKSEEILKSLRPEKTVPWPVVEAYIIGHSFPQLSHRLTLIISARNNYASSMSPFSEATNQEELLAIYEEAEKKLRSYA